MKIECTLDASGFFYICLHLLCACDEENFLYAGFFGGIIDRVLTEISNFFLQIPLIGLAVMVSYLLGFSFFDLAIATSIAWWPIFAVFVRNKARSVKMATFVASAMTSGDTATEITFRHIFPSILPDFAARVFIELGIVVQLIATVKFDSSTARPINGI